MGPVKARQRSGQPGRFVRIVRRQLAGTLAAVLVVTLAGEVPALAAPDWKPPSAPRQAAGVAARPLTHEPRPTWTAESKEVRGTPEVTWPTPGSAVADLAAAARRSGRDAGARTTSPRVRAGGLPVWVTDASPGMETAAPVDRVHVTLRDHSVARKAGVAGLVLDVRRSEAVPAAPGRPSADGGAVAVQVDYSRFAAAYGGDWSSRLRLVALPSGRPLNSRNDLDQRLVSAVVPLSATGAATTVALTSSPAGSNGDYRATSLSPASTWQVSQQTGDFSWQYPLRTVPAVGGPTPSMVLAYSSGSLDGRTGGSNTQGSWIGDGWDMWPGYVERQFVSCAADKDAVGGVTPNNSGVDSGDQCWKKPAGNATLSLNGRATELVKSTGNTWKGVTDDGSLIQLEQNTANGNGDDDGEFWKVTTPDGTQYFFGRNINPGGSSGATASKSTWTAPVYGNHPNEPGYTTGDFAASRRTQAWRWNLDHVIDPHGNTMSYFYEKETGAYGREGDPDKRTTYDRGGWLTRIEYGNRTNAGSSTYASARVLFDVADRCASNCWSDGKAVEASWLDTPWDQYCATAPCTTMLSPTFWTGKRLQRVRSQVYSGSGGVYHDVEWVTLRHTYLDAGSNEGKPMWLAGITRTGKATRTGAVEVSDPEIVLDPQADPLANRVDGPADGRSNLFRYRIGAITTESGAQIGITYSGTECTGSTLPSEHANEKRCYPQWYAPPGEEPTLDWFHKYRVERVDVYDNTGGFEHEQTNYDYLDKPAWHYDDSELVEEKKRTWGQFRGYGRIVVRKGLESGVQSAVEYRYLRGMDGDKQPTGTRQVTVTDSQGTAIEDHEAYAGMLREETTLLGANGTWVSGTINTPVRQGPTATSGPLKAWMTNTGTVRSRTKLGNGSTRWTRTTTTFNSDNLPTQVEDLGDESVASDDTCSRTWYARNGDIWMLDRVKREEKVGVDCAGTPSATNTLSSTRNTYDRQDTDWNTYLPVRGLVVKVEEIDSWTGSTPNWITISRTGYDANGRITESFDALGRRTGTAYTPALTGPVTSTVLTNALGHTNTTVMVPEWNVPAEIIDHPNGLRTDLSYDSLGRLTKVWLPGQLKSANPTKPNIEFLYHMRNSVPSAVTTKRLTGTGSAYLTAVNLYDGLLRLRQTQTQAPGGGRVLTDEMYDSRGLLERASKPYYDTTNAPPDTNLVGGAGWPAIPAVTENIYDGAGRLTNAILWSGSTEKWRTVTTYAGERTSVRPPDGGTATTTITDGLGRKVELREYKNPASLGSDDPTTFERTRYTYTPGGELATTEDQAGNVWRYTYDQRGRKIKDEDPDKGVTETTYDAVGQVATVKDARGSVLAHKYDDLGRKVSLHEGSVTGPMRAKWTYDTLQYGVGKLSSSTRYEPAGSTNAYTVAVKGYDTAGRSQGTAVTIPSTESGLCTAGGTTPCTYAFGTEYRADGQVSKETLPAAGGLAAETLVHTYNDVGLPTGLVSAAQIYVHSATYDKLSQLSQRVLGAVGKRTWLTYTTDAKTGRLTTASAVPELANDIFSLEYFYDDFGNLSRIVDTPNGGQAPETQCYGYDHLRRLTSAWTPKSGSCATAPIVTDDLGGPAPYWNSYEYDSTGNRTRETRHATNNVLDLRHAAPGGAAGSKPHAVSQIDYSGAVTKSQQFRYDQAGNTTCRPAGTAANTCSGDAGSQTLTWNPEGRLASVSGGTSFIYDADGNRLIRKDSAGATLYLPAGTEVRKPTSSAASGTRFYRHRDVNVAVRTVSSLHWLVGDHHNTASATVNDANLAVARQRTLPFGEVRGSSGTWPTAADKGFVGGTRDGTGLTHLGARLYDPKLGRFISVDPVVDAFSPQSLHGYAYAFNNPTTLMDPDGMWPWSKNAGKGLLSRVSSTVKSAGKAVSSAGKFVYENSGTISAGLGVAAMACAVIPGAQPIGAALGAASFAFGALDTIKSCSEGNGVDCGMGALSMLPGGKAIGLGAKALKLKKAKDAAAETVDATNQILDIRRARGLPYEARRPLMDDYMGQYRTYTGLHNDYVHANRLLKPYEYVNNVFLAENVTYESCKLFAHCDDFDSRHDMIFQGGDRRRDNGGGGKGGGGKGGKGNGGSSPPESSPSHGSIAPGSGEGGCQDVKVDGGWLLC